MHRTVTDNIPTTTTDKQYNPALSHPSLCLQVHWPTPQSCLYALEHWVSTVLFQKNSYGCFDWQQTQQHLLPLLVKSTLSAGDWSVYGSAGNCGTIVKLTCLSPLQLWALPSPHSVILYQHVIQGHFSWQINTRCIAWAVLLWKCTSLWKFVCNFLIFYFRRLCHSLPIHCPSLLCRFRCVLNNTRFSVWTTSTLAPPWDHHHPYFIKSSLLPFIFSPWLTSNSNSKIRRMSIFPLVLSSTKLWTY